MDINREPPKRTKLYVVAGAVIAVLGGASIALASMKDAVTTMDRSLLTIDTVSIGDVIRDVRAPGSLVPEHTRIIVATTGGRVETLPVRPGEAVIPATTIVQLSNADVELAALQVQQQLTQAYATLSLLRSQQQQQRTTQVGVIAQLRTQKLDADRALAVVDSLDKRQLASKNDVASARDHAQELATRFQLEERRLTDTQASDAEQLKLGQQQIDELKQILQEQHNRVASMRVAAGESGQLQSLGSPQLELGQWVNSGIELARVATAGRLKAVLHVPEMQAKNISQGQLTTIDTHDGVVHGHVTTIDPVSRGGTVTVEVALDGPLPKGARVDLAIDGAIEIERLHNVLHVGRPAYGAADGVIRLFKVVPNTGDAVRTNVTVGKASVTGIVIARGLARGDSVIISDMSQQLTDPRVRLR